MFLKVEIVSFGIHPYDGPATVLFKMHGGTLGRAKGNYIALPDESMFISRTHAQISYEDGRYYITDKSVNGTLIANKNLHLKDDKALLDDGDKLQIGDYQLLVSLFEPEICKPEITGSREGNEKPQQTGGLCIDDFFDSSSLIIGPAASPAAPEPSGPGPDGPEPSTPESGGPELRPEAPLAGPDDTGPAPKMSDDAAQAAKAAPGEAQKKLFDLFLHGAGLEGEDVIKEEEMPDVMVTLGAVFREMASGLWTFLRGRTEAKREMRVQVTMLLPTNNNPLKLSPTVEDAMKCLLKRLHPSFLEPVDAVSESFEDLMNHQLAMNAGIQASLDEALDHFKPENFAEKHKGGFKLTHGSKCWDEYAESYNKIRNEISEDFFGKQFVKAYEEQIEKLRLKGKIKSGT